MLMFGFVFVPHGCVGGTEGPGASLASLRSALSAPVFIVYFIFVLMFVFMSVHGGCLARLASIRSLGARFHLYFIFVFIHSIR